MKKIAVVANYDSNNILIWAGIPKSIVDELKKYFHVDVIILNTSKRTISSYFKSFWYNRIVKKRYYSTFDQNVLSYNLNSSNKIKGYEYCIFFQSFVCDFIDDSQKKIYITDATFDNLIDYYDYMTNLSSLNIQHGHLICKNALTKATYNVVSSNWAYNSIVDFYNIEKQKNFVIPFGANLDIIPTSKDIVDDINTRILEQKCNLIFIGFNWERKGGEDVLKIAKYFIQKNFDFRLTIIGCTPVIPNDLKNYINVIGVLDKTVEEQKNLFIQLIRKSHVMIMPSFAECYGCVYIEANAYGIPNIGRDTGGVSSIIKDKKTGLLISSNNSIYDVANKWMEIFNDKNTLYNMSLNSRLQYEKIYNYEVFVRELSLIMK